MGSLIRAGIRRKGKSESQRQTLPKRGSVSEELFALTTSRGKKTFGVSHCCELGCQPSAILLPCSGIVAGPLDAIDFGVGFPAIETAFSPQLFDGGVWGCGCLWCEGGKGNHAEKGKVRQHLQAKRV